MECYYLRAVWLRLATTVHFPELSFSKSCHRFTKDREWSLSTKTRILFGSKKYRCALLLTKIIEFDRNFDLVMSVVTEGERWINKETDGVDLSV